MCYSNSKSSWQMKGILSYRNGCRRHTLPAVYSAFTPSLLKWITKTIGNEEMIQRRSGWVSTTTRFLYIFYWNWKRLDTVNEKFTHGLGADCNKKKINDFFIHLIINVTEVVARDEIETKKKSSIFY